MISCIAFDTYGGSEGKRLQGMLMAAFVFIFLLHKTTEICDSSLNGGVGRVEMFETVFDEILVYIN